MAASFPSAVKAFVSRVAGDTIQPAHVNDLQDEVAAIETDLLTTTATSYTPTWTNGSIGNGTLLGRYRQRGKLVWVDIQMTAGTTTTFGGGLVWTFALPVTAADANGQAMAAHILDTGTAFYVGVAAPVSTTTISVYTNAGASGVNSSVPHTWATGDALRITGWYLAA